MNLTQNFTLEEFIFSDTATRKGIDNTPDAETVENLRLVASLLEQIRALFNAPIKITSGFRCSKLNTVIGSKPNSAHIQGFAADFVIKGFTPEQVCAEIAGSDIQFDQLISEGTWTHIGLSDSPYRRQLLTAHFVGGKATYTEGV